LVDAWSEIYNRGHSDSRAVVRTQIFVFRVASTWVSRSVERIDEIKSDDHRRQIEPFDAR